MQSTAGALLGATKVRGSGASCGSPSASSSVPKPSKRAARMRQTTPSAVTEWLVLVRVGLIFVGLLAVRIKVANVEPNGTTETTTTTMMTEGGNGYTAHGRRKDL